MKSKFLFITILIIIQALISIKADLNTDIGVEALLEKSELELLQEDAYEQILDTTNLTEIPEPTQSDGIQEFNAIGDTSAERVVMNAIGDAPERVVLIKEDIASTSDNGAPVSVENEDQSSVSAEIELAPVLEEPVVAAEPAVLLEKEELLTEETLVKGEVNNVHDKVLADVVTEPVVVEKEELVTEETLLVREEVNNVHDKVLADVVVEPVVVEREEIPIEKTLPVKEEVNDVHDVTSEGNSEGYTETKSESTNGFADVEIDEDDDNHEDDAMKEVSFNEMNVKYPSTVL
jgi:hypothetical protein